jgi:hypothetical protein
MRGGFAALTALAALASCAGEPAEAGTTPGDSRAAPAAPTRPATTRPATPTAPPAPVAEVYPLKEWMSANLARPVKSAEFEALEEALKQAASFAPPEFETWRSIASAGARAAHARDIEGVRQSCSDCHAQYRANYRDTMRSRPLPEMRRTR